MITEDDEFMRIEREIEQRKQKAADALTVVYSIKLTQNQRVKLLQLGGPKWLREQIDKAKKEPR
jgi:hypothetical protein